mgnify:CR=1 FL=1
MDLAFALRPHENARYQQAQTMLAGRELRCLMEKYGVVSPIESEKLGGADFLFFTLNDPPPDALSFLARHSSLYFAAERENGLLRPLLINRPEYVPAYMPLVLKYKGKTNASFTRLLINLAFCAGENKPPDVPTLLDPMCGRGTTLFSALSDGMNAAGIDGDISELREGLRFSENFFQYEHIPFTAEKSSRTLNKGRSAPQTRMTVGRGNDQRTLTFILADTRDACPAFPKGGADLLAVDLPYGVQHAPTKNGAMDTLPSLLLAALPSWKAALKPGAGAAISFNTLTLKRETISSLLTASGFTVLSEPYESFEHWVEQAVTRDIIVARA